ncbi:Non-phosphorylating glyceraldehyde-3-phosphate dehydrogenase (NADP) [Qipengyuania citrea LAMA 915]|uniref:Non-phosphorylating glyceraldehyde-3-phosphate dehydrogenase (NADP) n=1 Tax=Qipengyuania citrea LAMA 915 TaxID=1306953 RepID=A0A0L1KDI6_9SPHN|nr:Non-phosphorylating glyceraldehyde-3-phosphate dehydrogenase (NADP) [Qipengyuania citrea LAMA 915]
MVEFSIYSSSPRFLSCDLDRIFVWIDPEVRGGWVFRGQ